LHPTIASVTPCAGAQAAPAPLAGEANVSEEKVDIDWLKKNSFLDRNQIRDLIKNLDCQHFSSGQQWMGAVADLFSDLAPQSREIFREELEGYVADHVNFKIDYVRDDIERKLAEYPRLPESPKEAAQEVWCELRRLWGRFDYNPQCAAEFGESLSINGLYFEVRWILGQILSTFPDIVEISDNEWEGSVLPAKYSDLEKSYHIAEFLVKTLSDLHVQDFYSDMYPQALAAQLEAILEAETKDR